MGVLAAAAPELYAHVLQNLASNTKLSLPLQQQYQALSQQVNAASRYGGLKQGQFIPTTTTIWVANALPAFCTQDMGAPAPPHRID